MIALLLVDLQNDFMPGGALAVPEGNLVIPFVNELTEESFDWIVATKDWHPAEHLSFASNHPGKKIGDHVDVAGLDQILWPEHCIQGTKGAEFAPGWDTSKIDRVVYKGTNPLIDSYSTFYDNGHRQSTGLENLLNEKGIKEIVIAGLATDYCVKYSVLDALRLGFRPYVVVEACRGVNLDPQDSDRALIEMQKKGAILLSFEDVRKLLKKN